MICSPMRRSVPTLKSSDADSPSAGRRTEDAGLRRQRRRGQGGGQRGGQQQSHSSQSTPRRQESSLHGASPGSSGGGGVRGWVYHAIMHRPGCCNVNTHVTADRTKLPLRPASPLTHFDAQGQAHMVDVGAKAATHRVAVAGGTIRMQRCDLRADRQRHGEEGRRDRHRARGRDPGRQAHARPDPAVPPDRADPRGRRVRARRGTARRALPRHRRDPSVPPASRWKR